MILKKILMSSISLVLLTSCVGEDIITDESLLVPNLSFDRELKSVAIDENTQINLRLTIGNDVVNLNTANQFNIEFSSSNTEIFDVDSRGVITPKSSSLLKTANLIVKLTENNSENPRTAEIIDDIQIGVVTLSESEAKLISNSELQKIIKEGYDPSITITTLVKSISIENTNGIQLNAVFQNFKRAEEEVSFSWVSNNEDVLTVDDKGLIKPVSNGEATIKVSTIYKGEEVSNDLKIEVAEKDTIEENPIDTGGTGNNLGSGTFLDAPGYSVSGTFEIIEENGQKILRLSSDFNGSTAPDIVLYLSNSSNSNAGAPALAEVKDTRDDLPNISRSGAQDIIIPANTDPANFKYVIIYCRDFGVPIGFGKINR